MSRRQAQVSTRWRGYNAGFGSRVKAVNDKIERVVGCALC